MRKAELSLEGREYEVSSARILGLVAASQCSAYDCEFVSLAQDLDVPLVTADGRVLRRRCSCGRSPWKDGDGYVLDD